MKSEDQESCFSTPSSSTVAATSRPQRAKRAPPLNLRRFQGHAAGFLSLAHKRASIDHHGEQASRNVESGDSDDNSEDRFFDSREHRCCFSLCHAKIGTFVFCTWIFHEIVLSTIYLLTRLESGTNITSKLVILLACRLIQLPSMALLYVGLWRHHSYLLLPFAVIQLTLGAFADISTLMMLLEDSEQSLDSSYNLFPIPLRNPSVKWLNLVIPLLVYTLIMVALMWMLYRCFIYLKARNAHDEKRKLEKQQQVKIPLLTPPLSPPSATENQEIASIRNPPVIQRAQSDRYATRVTRCSDASLQNMVPAAGEKAATSPPELPPTENVRAKNGARISFSDTVTCSSADPNVSRVTQQKINDETFIE